MSEETTIPVILIGTEPVEAKGFDKVLVKRGESELLYHEGTFEAHMVNGTLVIQFKEKLDATKEQ